jgi:hypothetical protein
MPKPSGRMEIYVPHRNCTEEQVSNCAQGIGYLSLVLYVLKGILEEL